MDFGIWVEPEMVNVDSELYQAHPDWAMDIPGKNHSEGRNQRLLDLSRAEVQDYIKDTSTGAAGGGGTPLCAWTLPVYEGVDRAISGNFI